MAKRLVSLLAQTTKTTVSYVGKLFNYMKCPPKLRLASIETTAHQFYSFVLVNPWCYDARSKQFVEGSKWRLLLWYFWMFGVINFRVLFVVSQPLLGNVLLQPIGHQKEVSVQRPIDTMMYCIGTPFMLLFIVALSVTVFGRRYILKLYNSACATEQRVSDTYLKFRVLENIAQRYPYIKLGFVGVGFFPFCVGLLVHRLSLKYKDSPMFLSVHFCASPEMSWCNRFWVFADFVLGFYGTALVTTMAMIMAKCYLTVVAALVYTNERGLPPSKRRKLYFQLQVLMQYANMQFRTILAISQSLLLLGVVMINAAIPTMGRSQRIPQGNVLMQSLILLASQCLTFLIYEIFAKGELMQSESTKLLKSLNTRNQGSDNHGKRKRKKYKKLVDRYPRVLRLGRMPLMLQVGPFFSIEHGTGLDFCQAVINHTFNAIVLFQ